MLPMRRALAIILLFVLTSCALLAEVPVSNRARDVAYQAYGNHKHVLVTFNDGHKVKGTVSAADENGFTLVPGKGDPQKIAYADVRDVKKKWMGTGTKIAIGVGIGVAGLIGYSLIWFATHGPLG